MLMLVLMCVTSGFLTLSRCTSVFILRISQTVNTVVVIVDLREMFGFNNDPLQPHELTFHLKMFLGTMGMIFVFFISVYFALHILTLCGRSLLCCLLHATVKIIENNGGDMFKFTGMCVCLSVCLCCFVHVLTLLTHLCSPLR